MFVLTDVCVNWRCKSDSKIKRRKFFNWSNNYAHLDMWQVLFIIIILILQTLYNKINLC